MRASILAMTATLLVTAPFAYAGANGERTHGPCFNVQIQNERDNHSSVRQNCDMNFSRTVQAGHYNRAETIQKGRINDNKVRQYQYGSFRSLDR
ncbi:hypothetical protein [Thioalkalivibrio sp.]|uniref:hypothetical protein n=1 Tax=Thioalkalivibrio sp. TaxID=2093813 RepID=UPI0012D4FD87|nr:hypothetical protein [Thioalkalivibrio sp.]TVP79344.1 MAG: hypothetical protein EA346_10000 [Thioalkalivibrio sp.]